MRTDKEILEGDGWKEDIVFELLLDIRYLTALKSIGDFNANQLRPKVA